MQADQSNNHCYNKTLKPLAGALRNNSTKAEVCLWKYALRAGQMRGYTFKRQRPVLQYIADFMCQPLMLVIELDGGVHQDETVVLNDARRQSALESAGFTVLRFHNDEVLGQMGDVRDRILCWIDAFEGQHGIAGRTMRGASSPSLSAAPAAASDSISPSGGG